MLLLLFLTGFALTNGLAPGRTVTKKIGVNNGQKWGYWGTEEYCPPGTFASGYAMKIEADQFGGDDSALNAIRLTCSDVNGHLFGQLITSSEGPFGSWGITESCSSSRFMTSFQLQVEGERGNSDDTAANYIKFHCRDLANQLGESELVRPPGQGIWGHYGDWSPSCDAGSAICGIQTKVEGSQGSGDDTALNDVVFFCCSDTNTHGQIVGK